MGSFDPIDVELERAGATVRRPSHGAQRRGWLTVDWPSASAPVVLLLLLGAALGQQGLAILTPSALALMEPAAPVALAALGVLAAFGFQASQPAERRIAATASVQAVVTAMVVTVGIVIAGWAFPVFASPAPWTLALLAGVCAATSSSLPLQQAATPGAIGARVSGADALLPIVLGAVLMAILRETSISAAASLLAQSAIVALVIAVVGWLLLSHVSSDTEQRVFGVATVLLLGGVSDYLSVSALFSGLVAGTFWQFTGGGVRESIRRDISYVQHSLLVLVLLLAGASAGLSPAVLAVAIAYAVLRTTGKLAGGWCVRMLMPALPGDTGMRLIAPGIFGVAFAVNAVRAVGPEMAPLLTVVVTGTIACSLLAAFVRVREDSE